MLGANVRKNLKILNPGCFHHVISSQSLENLWKTILYVLLFIFFIIEEWELTLLVEGSGGVKKWRGGVNLTPPT